MYTVRNFHAEVGEANTLEEAERLLEEEYKWSISDCDPEDLLDEWYIEIYNNETCEIVKRVSKEDYLKGEI